MRVRTLSSQELTLSIFHREHWDRHELLIGLALGGKPRSAVSCLPPQVARSHYYYRYV